MPLPQYLRCRQPSVHDGFLVMWTHSVDAMCRALGTAVAEDEAAQHHKREWRKLQALINAIGRVQGKEPTRRCITILPAHRAHPEELTAADPCRAATDPTAWLGASGRTSVMWTIRPGLVVHEEG